MNFLSVKNNQVLVAIVLATGAFFFSCKSDIRAVQELGEDDTAPFQTVFNGAYTYTDSGKVRNTLYAGRLEQYIHDTDYTHVEDGLKLDIYNIQNRITASLTANRGYYFEKQNRMEAMEDVVFFNLTGDSLFTEHLIWKSDSHIIRTNEKVRIIRSGTEIIGKGLKANEDFSRYTILAPIGDITVPEEAVKDGSTESQ